MSRIVLSFILIISIAQVGVGRQQNKPFKAESLGLVWQLKDNHYNGQNAISEFILSNKGSQAFPASGWSIYFQYIKTINLSSVTGDVKIEHLNGTLYRIIPQSAFKGISSNSKSVISFITNAPIINYTDQPAGPYLVWDNNPSVAHKIKDFKVESLNKVASVSPATIFDQNRQIKTGVEVSKILPTPVKYSETPGSFVLKSDMEIATDAQFSKEADYLSTELAALVGKKMKVVPANKNKSIRLVKSSLPSKEAYRLSVTSNGITISASDAVGIFYGIQSLKAILPVNVWSKKQSSLMFPVVEVEDEPRFGYRGLLLDVVRGFQTKEAVFKVLDLMALYKLNVFHFHLNDDEGWRLEIPSFPELTEIGGKRGHTATERDMLPPAFISGPDPKDGLNTGFYTKEDFIEILKYAHERHIQVMPEIETPGHARAAIKAMAARYDRMMKQGKKEEALKYLLHDMNDSSKYSSAQRFKDNVLCVALPSVYTFIEQVVDDVIGIYKEAGVPLTTIHFGGDEVPAGVWEKSPIAQELIKKDPELKETGDLWYYFFDKINRMVKSKGMVVSGWEEIAMRITSLDGKKKMIANPQFANEGFQVDVWNNFIGGGMEDLPYRLANAGYKVVLSCASNFYFDLAYNKSLEEPGHYWAGFLDVDKPFYFIPFDYYKNSTEDYRGNPIKPGLFNGKDRLTDYGKSNILGIKGLLWSEKVHNSDIMEYHLVPKLIGMAERAWAKDPEWAIENNEKRSEQLYQESWSRFVNTLGKRDLPRLDYYVGGFNYRIPTVGTKVENGRVAANIQLPGLTIRYTTNGKEPGLNDKEYARPITEKGVIKLRAFDTRGRGGRTIEIENKGL